MNLEVMNSKSERERQIPDGFFHLWNINNQSKCTNKILTKLSQRLGEKKWHFPEGKGKEGRRKSESGQSMVVCFMCYGTRIWVVRVVRHIYRYVVKLYS